MATLTESAGIKRGDIVALVGAGGKTSTVARLVSEMRAMGRQVLTTSTVSMGEHNPSGDFYFLVEPDPQQVLEQVPALLREYGHVRLATERVRADKLQGIDPDWVEMLAALPGVDNLIIEADGARHRSLKAPNDREPVLPERLDVLFATAGLDVVGQPFGEEKVHRPEMVAALTGVHEGDTIAPEHVAAVLSSPEGGLKNVPPGARAWFLLTKWTPATDQAAREIARLALERAPQAKGAVLLGAGHSGAVKAVTR